MDQPDEDATLAAREQYGAQDHRYASWNSATRITRCRSDRTAITEVTSCAKCGSGEVAVLKHGGLEVGNERDHRDTCSARMGSRRAARMVHDAR